MLSKEALIAYGADYDKGIKLCLNKEDFYFRMIKQGIANEKFALLGEHLSKKDLKSAFEDAHALKGVAGNLALTPLFNAIEDIVEPLRRGEDKDYTAQYNTIKELKQKLEAIIA